MQKEKKKTLRLSCRVGSSSIIKGRSGPQSRSVVCPGAVALGCVANTTPGDSCGVVTELAFWKDFYYGHLSTLSFLFLSICESSSAKDTNLKPNSTN